MKIQGYKRGDDFGIRNHVVVVASVVCVNSIVTQIAARFKDVIPIVHPQGCGHLEEDRKQVLRTLANTCNNPNVAGVLVLGLGCENVTARQIGELIHHGPKFDRMMELMVVQEVGETEDVFAQATAVIERMLSVTRAAPKVEFDMKHLRVALKCGGSDIYSGITANPVVGLVSDRIIGHGGTTVLSEVPEMIGAEEALCKRIADNTLKDKLYERIGRYITIARDLGVDLRGTNPTPGNIAGGISSIEEKSLGCITKGGASPIVDFVDYAHSISKRGLVLMDTPGNDPECVTGMVAGGAQMVLFTTGRGTPMGHPIAPVLKISSNSTTFQKMKSFIDFDCGPVLDGKPLPELADGLFNLIVDVANGNECKAEKNKCREFSINRLSVTL